MSLALKATAFSDRGQIPGKYTCAGANLSPALQWTGVSPAADSLVLIVDDPDAPKGTWTHWLIWNIPAYLTSLPEGVAAKEELENGSRQGKNDFNHIGYGGPCPPPGRKHRYLFKLYALDAMLDLKAGADRKALEHAMKHHIVSQAEYVGIFGQ